MQDMAKKMLMALEEQRKQSQQRQQNKEPGPKSNIEAKVNTAAEIVHIFAPFYSALIPVYYHLFCLLNCHPLYWKQQKALKGVFLTPRITQQRNRRTDWQVLLFFQFPRTSQRLQMSSNPLLKCLTRLRRRPSGKEMLSGQERFKKQKQPARERLKNSIIKQRNGVLSFHRANGDLLEDNEEGQDEEKKVNLRFQISKVASEVINPPEPTRGRNSS